MTGLYDVSKSFGSVKVYDGFTCEFSPLSVTAVLGESGSGKTTLLNLLAGLIKPDGGRVTADAPVSFVFQEDRLLPNLTVRQNLELVCGKRDYRDELSKIGLAEYENAYIRELSGGMARRLSYLRAYLFPSALILLDEPFRGLDLKLKRALMDTFLGLQKSSPRTAVLVTHDPDEASYLASRIVIIGKGGKILADLSRDGDSPVASEKLKEVLLR